MPNNQKLEWHHIDAQGQVLGRLATQVAVLLMGKHRPDAQRHLVAPVRVVITNTDKIAVTGQKMEQKMYRHYTGYPGGLKERSLGEQMKRDSRVVIQEAVRGMLPKNSLRDKRLLHMKLYAGSEHPHLPQVSNK